MDNASQVSKDNKCVISYDILRLRLTGLAIAIMPLSLFTIWIHKEVSIQKAQNFGLILFGETSMIVVRVH